MRYNLLLQLFVLNFFFKFRLKKQIFNIFYLALPDLVLIFGKSNRSKDFKRSNILRFLFKKKIIKS